MPKPYEEPWVKRVRVAVEAAGYRWEQHTQWHCQVFGGMFRVDVYFKANGSFSAKRLGESTTFVSNAKDIIELAGAKQAPRVAQPAEPVAVAQRAGRLPPLANIRTPEAVAAVQKLVRQRYGDDNPYAHLLLLTLSKRLSNPIWLRDP